MSVPLPRSVNKKRAPLSMFDPLRNDPRFQKLAGRAHAERREIGQGRVTLALARCRGGDRNRR